MKKFVLIGVIVISVAIFFWCCFHLRKVEPFSLDDVNFQAESFIDINIEQMKQKIKDKSSFVVFIYQPMCTTSADFEQVLMNTQKNYLLPIYKIAFSSIKDIDALSHIKYYPSFAIFHNGKVIDYLKADKKEDVKKYKNNQDFENWLLKYVSLNRNEIEDENLTAPKEEEPIKKDIQLNQVVKEKEKVNIYFFWGNGCPHCEEEFEFFENLDTKYKDKINLYTFETWYNNDNKEIFKVFASSMKDEIKGVPYTIIGDRSFRGFGRSHPQKFIDAIENALVNEYDVYFDKIKKE